jgi:hypothetical protein
MDQLEAFLQRGLFTRNALEVKRQLLGSPLRAILDPQGEPSGRRRSAQDYLSLRYPLISSVAALPLTSFLSKTFNTRFSLYALPLLAATHIVFLAMREALHWGHYHLSTGEWCLLAALVYSAVFLHECGHASACRRFGISHGDIGIGLYWAWPVFYTDVSEVWTLSRRKRAIVDIGGIYFHLLFSTVCIWAWWLSGEAVFYYTSTSIVAATVVNLNPFLRFDGYWLLVDLLGLPSLTIAIQELRSSLTRLILRRTAKVGKKALPSTLWIRAVLSCYLFGSGSFFCWLTYRLTTRLPAIWQTVTPRQLHQLFVSTTLAALPMKVVGISMSLIAVYGLTRRVCGGLKRPLRRALLQFRKSSEFIRLML